MYLSFIIPVYNAEKFIEKCVGSIIDQGIDENAYELILVNDGSTDQTEKICLQLQNEYGPIRYYSKENAGPGHSRNYGLAKAKGEYIWFIDADDYLEKNVAKELLTHLNEDHDIYIFGYQAVDLEGSIIRRQNYNTEVLEPIEVLKKEYFVNMVWCKLIKRAVLEKYGLQFREDIRGPEDFHFSFRLMALVESIKTIDLICYNYIENPASLMNKRSDAHMVHLANDSITAGNDLTKYLQSIEDNDKQKAFGFWLSNFMYGLLFSFFRFKYSPNYVSSALDGLKLNGNYPVKLDSKNWKRNMFTQVANTKPVFLWIIKLKRILGH